MTFSTTSIDLTLSSTNNSTSGGETSPQYHKTMMFQIENTPGGYVVSCYYDQHWHPLRNFGDRQGDARFFKEHDCPKLEDGMIRVLIKHYNPSVKYIRLNGGRFKKQREDI